jgi:hypothetical protein
MLKYALYPNPLTKRGNDFKAIAQSFEIISIEDIIRQITIPGSILKETECAAVIHDFFKAIAHNLEEGRGFASEYIRIHPKVTGVFTGKVDLFDPERHSKELSIFPKKVFKDAVDKMKLQKVEASVLQADITAVYDLKSQQTDTLITPGNLIEVLGSKLKLNTELADEGMFLINNTDGSEIKIQHLHTNLPGKLSAMLPDNLPSGSYSMEVRKRPERNKTLVTGVHTKQLKVN